MDALEMTLINPPYSRRRSSGSSDSLFSSPTSETLNEHIDKTRDLKAAGAEEVGGVLGAVPALH